MFMLPHHEITFANFTLLHFWIRATLQSKASRDFSLSVAYYFSIFVNISMLAGFFLFCHLGTHLSGSYSQGGLCTAVTKVNSPVVSWVPVLVSFLFSSIYPRRRYTTEEEVPSSSPRTRRSSSSDLSERWHAHCLRPYPCQLSLCTPRNEDSQQPVSDALHPIVRARRRTQRGQEDEHRLKAATESVLGVPGWWTPSRSVPVGH